MYVTSINFVNHRFVTWRKPCKISSLGVRQKDSSCYLCGILSQYWLYPKPRRVFRFWHRLWQEHLEVKLFLIKVHWDRSWGQKFIFWGHLFRWLVHRLFVWVWSSLGLGFSVCFTSLRGFWFSLLIPRLIWIFLFYDYLWDHCVFYRVFWLLLRVLHVGSGVTSWDQRFESQDHWWFSKAFGSHSIDYCWYFRVTKFKHF